MMTAGIAATRPIAVASNASAIPGATTARLVVCDFEMPIKLFMMPHTVPNSPTKGEVAPMVASKPMPSRIRRASARTISAKPGPPRLCDAAAAETPRRHPRLARGGGEQRRQHGALGAERELRFRQRSCFADLAEGRAQLALHHRQLDDFGDEDGPGQQRGEGQAD